MTTRHSGVLVRFSCAASQELSAGRAAVRLVASSCSTVNSSPVWRSWEPNARWEKVPRRLSCPDKRQRLRPASLRQKASRSCLLRPSPGLLRHRLDSQVRGEAFGKARTHRRSRPAAATSHGGPQNHLETRRLALGCATVLLSSRTSLNTRSSWPWPSRAAPSSALAHRDVATSIRASVATLRAPRLVSTTSYT